MRNRIDLVIIGIAAALNGCSKHSVSPSESSGATEVQVLADFAQNVALANYEDLLTKTTVLAQASGQLRLSTTDSNLAIAQSAWRSARTAWEQAEGFLFGPIEDYNYDPTVDTWPLSRTEMDSLLASGKALTVSDVDALPYSLKGFHAIEYILFGAGSAAYLSARDLDYLGALTQSLQNTANALFNSWDPNQAGNFSAIFVGAGPGNERYPTRRDAFLALVEAMVDICDEVADEKMQDPLIKQDSTLDESPFAHNSTTDFRNNITGVENAYLGKYFVDGHGLNELVAEGNLSLDEEIQSELSTAINSFDAIGPNFESAIYVRQAQVRATQAAIRALRETLESKLVLYLQTTITD
ncbi:MAG TPA: imelysin family protein [Bacteroidota bacterium]|nr:imelysin family protein [Bacteroidota bacterium]